MQPITILCVLLCFGVLYLRYQSQPKDRPPRTRQQKLKTAKILGAAILAWMSIGYALQHLNENLTGSATEASWMERAVSFLSK